MINKLPSYSFEVELKSHDDPDGYKSFGVIYFIEAFVQSPDEHNLIKTWVNALSDEGILVIIDDFLTVSTDKEC